MTLGDDHPCRVIGVGSIRVRMFDGVTWTLTHVKHVLDLKKKTSVIGLPGEKRI